VDKSLVVAQEDDAGDVRYRLLETVRAYCGERLEESGDRERIRTAHAEYFVALAERAEPKLRDRRADPLDHPADPRTRQLQRRVAPLRDTERLPDRASALPGSAVVLDDAQPGAESTRSGPRRSAS
jgi:predicted ATPase